MSVTADVLNVRSGPDAGTSVIDQLGAGEVAEADGTIRNGFRQMGATSFSCLHSPGTLL